MTAVDDEFTFTAEMARRMKREKVAEAWEPDMADDDEALDLVNHVAVFRDGGVVAQVWASEGPGGSAQAAYVAAGFMRADVVFIISDGYTTDGTQTPPERGHLGRLWHEGKRDGISETLFALRVTPDEIEFREWPYVRDGKAIRWTPGTRMMTVTGGGIIDAARAGFEFRRTRFVEFEERAFSMLPAALRHDADYQHHLDRAVARFVSQAGCPVALFSPASAFVDGEEVPITSLRV